VRITRTGSSSLTPKELADNWEAAAAAVAAKNLNHGRNNIDVNGKLTTISFLSTRTDFRTGSETRSSRAAKSHRSKSPHPYRNRMLKANKTASSQSSAEMHLTA